MHIFPCDEPFKNISAKYTLHYFCEWASNFLYHKMAACVLFLKKAECFRPLSC